MIRIVLAGEPRGKGRPRFSTRNGKVRTFTPEATRSYEDVLRLTAQEVMVERPPLEDDLAIEIGVFCPIPKSWSKAMKAWALEGLVRPSKKPDVDNIMKMVDALNEVVWRDDCQIVEAVVRKFYSDRPRLEIDVRPLPAPPNARPRPARALPDFME